MRWGGVERCLTNNQNSTSRGMRAHVAEGVLGPHGWLGLQPQHCFLLGVRFTEVVWTLQAPELCLWSLDGIGGSISDRFYPAHQWFSKQCTQNNSINITRKLAGRVNSWVPSHIQWIRNSESGAQESVLSIPRLRDWCTGSTLRTTSLVLLFSTRCDFTSLLSPTLETFLTVTIGEKRECYCPSSG